MAPFSVEHVMVMKRGCWFMVVVKILVFLWVVIVMGVVDIVGSWWWLIVHRGGW